MRILQGRRGLESRPGYPAFAKVAHRDVPRIAAGGNDAAPSPVRRSCPPAHYRHARLFPGRRRDLRGSVFRMERQSVIWNHEIPMSSPFGFHGRSFALEQFKLGACFLPKLPELVSDCFNSGVGPKLWFTTNSISVLVAPIFRNA